MCLYIGFENTHEYSVELNLQIDIDEFALTANMVCNYGIVT